MYHLNNNLSLDISKDGLKGYIVISKDDDSELGEFNIDGIVKEVKEIIKYGLKEEVLLNLLKNKIVNEKYYSRR